MLKFRTQRQFIFKIVWTTPAFLALVGLMFPAVAHCRCSCCSTESSCCSGENPSEPQTESVEKTECPKCCCSDKSDSEAATAHVPKKSCCSDSCQCGETDANGYRLPCSCSIEKDDLPLISPEKYQVRTHLFQSLFTVCSNVFPWNAFATCVFCDIFHPPQLRLHLLYCVMLN